MMRAKWLNIFVITFTTILWLMQMIPQESEGEWFIYPYLRKFKYWIALFSFLLVICLHLYDILINRDSLQKAWIKKLLKQIVNLDLGGNNHHTRISVLCPRKGYQIFAKRFYYFVILHFFDNFKCGTWKQSFRLLPIHLFSEYLIVYQRFSYPREKKSYTYFRVMKDNGVAVKCFEEGIDCEVNTICISDIELPDNYSELTGQNLKHVRKYMKESYISEQNYDTLRAMIKRANNIYATPIIDEQQHIWGVLIIDNDEKSNISFKQKLDSVINCYINIFSFTISHLKKK